MITPWGEQLDPESVLAEYPRPQLVRDSYLNLNGHWQYAITAAEAERPQQWEGQILVPFSPEAPLSGVGRTLQPDQALWYHRRFALPAGFIRDRVLLHIGAADQDAEVWLDGTRVGSHRGGFLPFTLDLTAALTNTAEHELVVRVRDDTDTSHRSRGKQKLDPGGIWYTPQSGIWQTVWLESVPAVWVDRLELGCDLDRGQLTVVVQAGEPTDQPARVTLSSGGVELGDQTIGVGEVARFDLADPRPWSPQDPFLYDLTVELGRDRVTSYTALRTVGLGTVGLGTDPSGATRMLLNGEPYLHAGLLDQGYWPDGLLTAPSDEALVFDIQTAKDLGFTVLRKHIKIEPLRWYHHCDRLGMLVWQDLVNGGRSYHPAVITAPVLTPLKLDDTRHRLFGRQDEQGRQDYLAELEDTLALLANAPSVVVWVPFNEGWGQFDSVAVTERVRELDPTRLIDSASGWHDQGAGDLVSRHVYFKGYRLSRADQQDPRAAVLSEYGGYSHRVPGHTWSDREFGYKRFTDRGAFTRAWLRLQQHQVRPAIGQGLAGFVLTQLSDVETETNGLVTYDRRVLKLDAEAVRASNAGLSSEFDAAVGRVPAAVRVIERELTAPVSLTLPDGRLNPSAIGWSRTPVVNTDGIGRGLVGRGRNKRWEYWAVTTPTQVLAVVVSDIDYAGVNGLWCWNRQTGEIVAEDVITPLGRGVQLPGTLGEGPTRLDTPRLGIELTEVPGGTRIVARTDRLRADVVAHRPSGHEALGVVVPWTEKLFQYTVKDVARPATGTITIDDRPIVLPEAESWATLDHGRGRWPHRVQWNWGAGSGHSAGHTLGLQVGGQWTDGTGSVENSLLVDGRLHKLSEELIWSYDREDWMAPWRITGEDVQLVFTPEHLKHGVTDFKLVSSATHQCFGSWSGTVRVPSGEVFEVVDLFGWAEDVKQKW